MLESLDACVSEESGIGRTKNANSPAATLRVGLVEYLLEAAVEALAADQVLVRICCSVRHCDVAQIIQIECKCHLCTVHAKIFRTEPNKMNKITLI